MKPMSFAIALIVISLPTLSLASGCKFGKKEQAMSCATGSTYDTATQSCLPVNT